MTTAPASSPQASELRQRAAKASEAAKDAASSTAQKTRNLSSTTIDKASSTLSITDLLRALAGLLLVSTLASYAVTSGQSYTWTLLSPQSRPWYLTPSLIRAYFTSPIELTNDALAAFDGSDEGKPIYLALNRTIYDVSASRHVYGPGGMYSALAAKDASRSYITTCFDPVEDLVPYFGGVEEVYVPLWLSRKPTKEELDDITKATGNVFGGKDAEDLIDEIRKKVGRKHVKRLQREAYAEARERVKAQVRSWEGMFGMKKYPTVGRVVGVDEVSEEKWRHLGFCEAARKLRPNMADSLQRAMESVGKGDKLNINMNRAMDQMKKRGGGKKGKKEGGEETDDDANKHADAKIEDMMPGGKYYKDLAGKGKKKERKSTVEDKVRRKLEHGDAEKAKMDMEELKADHPGQEPQIPNAVPDAVLGDDQRRAL